MLNFIYWKPQIIERKKTENIGEVILSEQNEDKKLYCRLEFIELIRGRSVMEKYRIVREVNRSHKTLFP